jgi:hypothetical protein
MAEQRPPVYSGSGMQRERWTDERLDDLAEAVRSGFDRIDGDIRELRQTVLRTWVTMISVQMVGFLGIIGTVLAHGG